MLIDLPHYAHAVALGHTLPYKPHTPDSQVTYSLVPYKQFDRAGVLCCVVVVF